MEVTKEHIRHILFYFQ